MNETHESPKQNIFIVKLGHNDTIINRLIDAIAMNFPENH